MYAHCCSIRYLHSLHVGSGQSKTKLKNEVFLVRLIISIMRACPNQQRMAYPDSVQAQLLRNLKDLVKQEVITKRSIHYVKTDEIQLDTYLREDKIQAILVQHVQTGSDSACRQFPAS